MKHAKPLTQDEARPCDHDFATVAFRVVQEATQEEDAARSDPAEPEFSFARKHETLGTSPAVAAGPTDHVWTSLDIVALLDQSADSN